MKSFLLPVVLFAAVLTVEAQQPKALSHIGFLSGGGNTFSLEEFKRGLQDLGYIEGKNIQTQYLSAEGNQERIPGLVAEMLQHKVDIIVTTSPGVRAAKQATKTTPIVMITQEDPIATGLVASLAYPGGNLTGVTSLARDLGRKRLEMLKEIVPKTSRVGVLWDTSDPAIGAVGYKEYLDAAPALKIQLQSLEVRGPNPDLAGAFQTAVKGRVSVLITIRNFLFNRYQKQIANLAIKHRLPSMHGRSDYVEAGGLASYSSNDADNYRRAAYFVDRILKGAKPADLPVEQPTKFEFVINLKTAKQIGLEIPQWTLMKANRVIK
jgi:putative tryptophan/tyrosine transport system substrate-binding protein